MRKSIYVILAMLVVAGFAITSCSDDDAPVKADTSVLLDSIAVAKDLIANTSEGVNDGQFPAGSKAIVQTAVSAAQTVADNAALSQTDVDNAISSLHQVMNAYRAKVIRPIAEAALVGHWAFNEGTGTTVSDETAHHFNGTFKTGHTLWGAGTPTWATDRFGVANKALHFDKGGNVEIPYNTALNPQKITISLWMKQEVNDPIVNNQYMIGLNRWNGYKLNMQNDPKAFFTVKVNTDGGIKGYDHDNAEPLVTQGLWWHVVVTFGDGHMIFYLNGEQVKDWEDTPGTGISLSANPINLVFGQDLPTNKYNDVEGSDFYVNWGGYFIGTMDDIRIYNTPLTASQVQTIYTREKP